MSDAKIWVPQRIQMSDGLRAFIAAKFRKGGNSQFEIQDVIESEPQEDLAHEAWGLRHIHGEFVLKSVDYK